MYLFSNCTLMVCAGPIKSYVHVQIIATSTNPATNKSFNSQLAWPTIALWRWIEKASKLFASTIVSMCLSEWNGDWLLLVHACSYSCIWQWGLFRTSASFLWLLNSSTWLTDLRATFLWLALLIKVPQLQQWLPHNFFANCIVQIIAFVIL